MAEIKISQLPAATTPLAGTEEVPLVQSGVTKKTTIAAIVSKVGAVTAVAGTAGRITSTGGTTPVIDLASGVATPGTTGSSALIPVVTVDTYGRVTSVTTAANPQGTVTSVTGTAPVVSSGGATPAISMAAATGSVNGYLTSTDWTTFNSKQPAGSYLVNGGALGTPSSGTATNLTGLPLSTGVTGLLPIANGGTNSSSESQAFARLNPITTIVSSGTPITLTNASTPVQLITGTAVQTIVLPVTSTLEVGWLFTIINNSTQNIPVQTSAGTALFTLLSGITGSFRCIATGSTAVTDWEAGLTEFSLVTGTGAVVLQNSPTLQGALNLIGGTTANALLATALTTGTLTIGSTTQTGLTTIGQSTLSSTTGVAAGVTATGNTNTLSIGTAGAAGSTTNITLGSAAGTSTATINGSVTLSGGTANGVAYLNGSKVLTTGSALTFDGSTVLVNAADPILRLKATADTQSSIIQFGDTSSNFSGVISYNHSVDAMQFFTAGQEQMRLTITGLGIGTSSPAYKLHVANYMGLGTQASTGAGAGINMIPSSTLTNWFVGSNYVNPGAFEIIPSTAGGGSTFSTPALVLNSSGNLGLGVTPSAWGATYRAMQIGLGGSLVGRTNAQSQTIIGANWYVDSGNKYIGTGAASQYQQDSGVHYWFTAASGTAGNAISFTQAMTLDSSSNLLVATTSFALSNSNNLMLSGGSGQIYAQHSSAEASGSLFALFCHSGNVIGTISQAGTTGVLYNVTSDYRLKTVIGPVANAGQRIDALQPVEYTWNADGSHTRGFLAHQFQEVYSSSVSGAKDDVDAEGKPVYQAMQASSSEVIADLVAEIQSLRARVAQLETN